jgi:hypothetical protein
MQEISTKSKIIKEEGLAIYRYECHCGEEGRVLAMIYRNRGNLQASLFELILDLKMDAYTTTNVKMAYGHLATDKLMKNFKKEIYEKKTVEAWRLLKEMKEIKTLDHVAIIESSLILPEEIYRPY